MLAIKNEMTYYLKAIVYYLAVLAFSADFNKRKNHAEQLLSVVCMLKPDGHSGCRSRSFFLRLKRYVKVAYTRAPEKRL